ncbi:SsgA family sporulation/cell division regulator [Kitasatospora sp. NPDC096147]|uniref:SsgA family sporulation/cell division regulator n=1 Tax=Kitasatospora sp. NPDC096147 TaxID=3364093 RepID=UPI0037FD7ADF
MESRETKSRDVDGGVLERDLTMDLLVSPQDSIPVRARLGYRTEDPYAVHVTFHVQSASPVSWYFARELLAEGVYRATGNGDVRVWPTTVGGRGLLTLMLRSLEGDVLLQASAETVADWVRQTEELVPPGTERVHEQVDRVLRELLADGSTPGAAG